METLQKNAFIENDQRFQRKTVAALFELMRNTNDRTFLVATVKAQYNLKNENKGKFDISSTKRTIIDTKKWFFGAKIFTFSDYDQNILDLDQLDERVKKVNNLNE
jgi:hypothetical protein